MCRVWRAIIVLGLSILFQVWAIVCLGLIISIPPLVSSPFPTILSVWRVPASLSCCLGVHGWVTRTCQPRDLSPSWSWLHADSRSSWMILMHFDMVSQIWPYQKSKLQFIIKNYTMLTCAVEMHIFVFRKLKNSDFTYIPFFLSYYIDIA